MDAGGIEKEVEEHSAAIAEWSARETDEAEEASEMKHYGMDTTTEAVEPGGGVAEVTPTWQQGSGRVSPCGQALLSHTPLNTPEPGGTRPQLSKSWTSRRRVKTAGLKET